ncbi:hypothetical protein DFH09DRAFT_437639 [Mycena vulgaris]|nr:hypothetical protein DFH09DRAFT_437639 [Mycena vulgaris]
MAPSVLLPLDLLRPIVSSISDRESLLSLCLVSEPFLHEAQPQLFTDVALHSDAVASFCCTVSASSLLARHVRRLSIQLSSEFSDTEALATALHALPGLRALEITGTDGPAWARTAVHSHAPISRPWAHRVSAKILHGCPFRLQTFASGFHMADPDFIAFLQEQPELEELVSYELTCRALTVEAGVLPALQVVRTAVTRVQFEPEVQAGIATPRAVREERMDIEVFMGTRHPATLWT